MIFKLIILKFFIECYFCYLLFEFAMKIHFSEKIHLNFTSNDYTEYVFKLLVFNESKETIHSSLDFFSQFEHYKFKKFK